MTRYRLDVDPEGWAVRPRTRQTRKEPTMTSQPDTRYLHLDDEQTLVVHPGRIAFAIESEDAVWLIADPPEGQPGGRLLVDLGDASAAMAFARDLTYEVHALTDQENHQ